MHLCMGCMKEITEDCKVCPHCGYRQDSQEPGNYLAPGTILRNKYLIGRVLGIGGFGITYIGYDCIVKRKVAIKEFFPGSLATRNQGIQKVTVYSGEAGKQFAAGLESFLLEARQLAEFSSVPEIVNIYDYIRENDTGYIVMEFLEGQTVAEMISGGRKLSYGEAEYIILRVLSCLSIIHTAGIIHRDISPDNLFITKDLQVKILDFGAARYAAAEASRSLSVILKPGYAPEEQYRSRGEQGTWTDIYAVGATFYRMLTGTKPPEALERLMDDKLQPPSQFCAELTLAKEKVLLASLAVKKENRIQTAEEFRTRLLMAGQRESFQDSPAPSSPPQETGEDKTVPWRPGISDTENYNHAEEKESGSGKPSKGKKTGILLGVIALLAALAGGSLYLIKSGALHSVWSQNQTEETELPQTETAQLTLHQLDPVQTEEQESGTVQTETEQPESVQTEAPQAETAQTELPQPETAQEDASPKAVLSIEDVLISGAEFNALAGRIQVQSVAATSENEDEGRVFYAENTLNLDEEVCWQEAVPGNGAGESLTYTFEKTETLNYILLKSGHWRDWTHFRYHNRPSKLKIITGQGESEIFLEDGRQIHCLWFNAPVETDFVEIQILETYSGYGADDTCVTYAGFGYSQTPPRLIEEAGLSQISYVRMDEMETPLGMEIFPAAAKASSELNQDGIVFEAEYTLDGSEDTSWQDGLPGNGIGEYLEYTFPSSVPLNALSVKLGNWLGYENNNRPSKLTFVFDSGICQVEFPDLKNEQCILFDSVQETQTVGIYVDAVYLGAKNDDTCITEIRFWTKGRNGENTVVYGEAGDGSEDYGFEAEPIIPVAASVWNGHSYMLYDNGLYRREAERYCSSMGGHLATVESQEENAFLCQYLTECGYGNAFFGMVYRGEEGGWQWVNQEEAVYSNWGSGEPDSSRETKDYAMFSSQYPGGEWKAGEFGAVGGEGNAYLCEWDTVR